MVVRFHPQLILPLFLSLPAIAMGQIFGGGSGDGSAVDRLSGSTLSGGNLNVLYAGGFGDGSDILLMPSTTLNGQSVAALFSGGAGDGYDVGSTSTTVTGLNVAALYSGGSGDGFDHLAAFSLTLQGTTPVDIDLDGIPNDWELLYPVVLNPNDPNDATLDSDGDGFLNIEEYEANTNPNDPNSRFQARIVRKGGGGFEVIFNTAADRYYRLQSGNDLLSYPTVTAPVQGTGSEMRKDLPAGDRVFGRVEVQVSP